MAWILRGAYSWLVGESGDKSSNNEDYDSDDSEDDKLHDIINQETASKKDISSGWKIPESRCDFNVQHIVGKVTKLSNQGGVLDNQYVFGVDDVTVPNLKLGSRVSFTVFRMHEEQEWMVKNILAVHDNDENWELEDSPVVEPDAEPDEPESLTESSAAIHRSIVGQVVERIGREVVVRDTQQGLDRQSLSRDTRFSLDGVSYEFTPIVGDFVILDAFVELDEKISDLSGEVLSIQSLKPLRSKSSTGRVTNWSPQRHEGIIDSEAWFDRYVCTAGYVPEINDEVSFIAIECDFKEFTWRALKIEPLEGPEVRKEQVQLSDSAQTSINHGLAQNKHGIIVSENTHFGKLNLGEKLELELEVLNTSSSLRTITNWFFREKQKGIRQLKVLSPTSKAIELHAGSSVRFNIQCNGTLYGHDSEVFVIQFDQHFMIGRLFTFEITSEEIFKMLTPSRSDGSFKRENAFTISAAANAEYQRMTNKKAVVRGVPHMKSAPFVPVKLPVYNVPEYITQVMLESKDGARDWGDKVIQAISKRVLGIEDGPVAANYSDVFHNLLYIAEVHETLEMRKYDMKAACFKQSGECLSLEVPGLIEKQPPLVVGDTVLVDCEWQPDSPTFQGYIHRVGQREVFIKFNRTFHQTYNGEIYNVTFRTSRTVWKRCHQAINLTLQHLGTSWLFPTSVNRQLPQFQILEESNDVPKLKSPESNFLSLVEKSASRALSQKKQNETPQNSTKVLNGNLNEENANVSAGNTAANGSPLSLKDQLLAATRGQQILEKSVTPNSDQYRLAKGSRNLEGLFKSSKKQISINWCNKHLNLRQRNAVTSILKGEARPLPYVIFGPPGTGKTVTLVEAILQIYLLKSDSRLLVGTPSNSSADMIAERILDSQILQPGDLVRVVAFHRVDAGLIPAKLLPYCTTTDINSNAPDTPQATNYGVTKSSAAAIGRHRITIGTCVALGQMFVQGFPRGHFTHVIVDEAGQATEPEILIPISFLDKKSGQCVLAGDPLQLGPVVKSRLAERLGLEQSFLVRLLKRSAYSRDHLGFPDSDGYNPLLVTRLNMNYRSLPVILDLPSSLFYDSELEARVSEVNSYEAVMMSRMTKELKLPESPVIFCGVLGQNLRDDSSPSWYNPHEVSNVVRIVKQLYDCKISVDDIGIITPYQKQAQKLRYLLEKMEVPAPKIGTVEEFQGQERLVIIISTVRSKLDAIGRNVKQSLGFVAQPRRLNVALSRARALLIIVGNPSLLSKDFYWRSVIKYCCANKGYYGCELPRGIEAE